MARRKGYGQFCPVAKAAEIVAERWTPLIVRELLCGSHRFNDLRRGLPLMSPTLLSQRLKELEWAGIVERRDSGSERGVEYHLTEAGQALRPVIELMGDWGQQFARSHMGRDDLDPGLLMWDMRRRLNVDTFPTERAVIHFEFSRVPSSKRDWWLVVDQGEVDLCLKDPGFDVDLYVATDIETMARVWLGKIDVRSAVHSGALELEGSAPLRRSIHRWLGLSLFAPGARKT